MKRTSKAYQGLKVEASALLRLDRFSLAFSDGTDVTLTLRQIQAIRLLPYSKSGIVLSALPALPALAAPVPAIAKAIV